MPQISTATRNICFCFRVRPVNHRRALACWLGCWLFCGATAVCSADDAGPPRRALLIGVAEYPRLPSSEQLRGCANDVAVMRSLLQERFAFQDRDIVTLVNAEATGSAIRGELERLIQWLDQLPSGSPMAQVVFHFSGHGSQLPDQPDGPDRDEDDGLDETLVPYDASRQGGPEDLRDDELYAYAERICAGDRARIWAVLDCCHSGTGARGVTRVRQLVRDLAITVRPIDSQPPIVNKRLPTGAVVLSACRAREVEPEYDQGDASYGLLTRFLVQVLQETPKVSDLSIDVLREAVVDRYRRDPAVSLPPAPQLEGGAAELQGPVLGASGTDRAPWWRVSPDPEDRDAVLLQAGALHGLTAGSLYQVYDDPAQIDWQAPTPQDDSSARKSATFWVEVTKVGGTTSQGRVFRWYGDEREEDSPPRGFQVGFAVERYHEHGDFGIRLRVVSALDESTDGPPLGPDSPALPDAVKQALVQAQDAQESNWRHWVTDDSPCDFVLRVDGRYAAIFPATGKALIDPRTVSQSDLPPSLRGGWGPIDLQDGSKSADTLTDYLRRIARVRNLLRIVQLSGAGVDGASDRVQVQMELLEVEELKPDGYSIKSSRPWPLDGEQNLVMRDGQLFAFRITNSASADGPPVYITVLQIDADMGISQVLPYQEGVGVFGEQYLEPGAIRVTDVFKCNGDLQEAPVYGRRQALVLATREPNAFYMLQHESLPRVRSGAGPPRLAPPNRSLEGPAGSLESLLLQQTYFRTRGGSSSSNSLYDNSWGAALVEWTVVSP